MEMFEEYALKYQALGWSPMPIDWRTSRPKKPLLASWEPFQKKVPSKEQIKSWAQKWPKANIGIITGEVSRILVVDIESKEGREAFAAEFGDIPATISQKTGKKHGVHLFFRHPLDGFRYQCHTKIRKDIDTRGEGGYVVVAPSKHPSGRSYEWINNPLEMGLDDLLDLGEIRELFTPEEDKKAKKIIEKDDMWVHEALAGVPKGQRNDMCARLAGYYFRVYPGETEKVTKILEGWNDRNKPPLDWKEVEKTIESIAKRAGRETLGDIVGEKIRNIQILIYPDGTRKYNVFLENCEGYAQMSLQELGTFTRFRWKFGELAGYIPKMVKQTPWEHMVNRALGESETLYISEDETVIGLISGAINSEVFGEGKATNMNMLGNRIIVVSGPNGDENIMLKMETIMSMIKFEERVTRKTVGEVLRKLGFENILLREKSKVFRCWQTPFPKWKVKYYTSHPHMPHDAKIKVISSEKQLEDELSDEND